MNGKRNIGYTDDTYLIPLYLWDEQEEVWNTYIEERTLNEANEVVFAWKFRDCATPFEALEVVVNEYVRMSSSTIGYFLDRD